MHASLAPSYDPTLVCLSLLIAVLASYVGLDLVRRGQATTGHRRTAWISTASIVVGGGIWAMHFVGMLALDMGVPVSYDVWGTLTSAVIAMVAAAGAFFVVSRRSTHATTAAAGVLMGLAIVTMHYLGMAAMHAPGRMSHDPGGIVAATAIAIAASWAALVLAFGERIRIPLPAAAVMMGLAIAGMHYVAMSRMSMEHVHASAIAETGIDSRSMALLVAGASFLILFMGLVTAMADRRLAEIATRENADLRRANDFNSSLLESTQEGILAFDRDLRITVWNTALGRMTSLLHDDVVGKNLKEMPFWSPETEDLVDRMFQGHEVVDDVLVPTTQRLCVIMASPIKEADGTVRGGLIVVRDETDLRRAQEALRQSQKLEALGHMTGSVAHDFNNLLMIIGGNADSIPRDAGNELALSSIQSALERGNGLMRKLLAFSRRQTLSSTVVDLAIRTKEFLPLIRSAAGPRVQVELTADSLSPLVDIDINEFEIALINLVVNAKDAMPNGGTLRISIGASKEGGAEVLVEDDGTGMTPDAMSKAFEPFFTTKEPGKGSGLGLSQVYGVVKQSGGQIELTSEIGSGTTFRILLPSSSKPLHMQASSSRNALVVERHPEVADVLGGLIGQTGLAVSIVPDIAGAMSAMSTSRVGFSVVFMDAETVGDEDGRFVESVRHRMPGCIVIMGTDHRTRKAKSVDLLLRKPYSLIDIEKALTTTGLQASRRVPSSA